MSATTRIKRPTTATPRKLNRERFVWVSTPMGHIPRHVRQRRLGIPATGMTYRATDRLPR